MGTGLTHLGISYGKSIFCSLKRAISDFKFRSAKMRKLATLKQFAFFNASRNLKFFPEMAQSRSQKNFYHFSKVQMRLPCQWAKMIWISENLCYVKSKLKMTIRFFINLKKRRKI
jgi:hypothetical protein